MVRKFLKHYHLLLQKSKIIIYKKYKKQIRLIDNGEILEVSHRPEREVKIKFFVIKYIYVILIKIMFKLTTGKDFMKNIFNLIIKRMTHIFKVEGGKIHHFLMH